VRSMVDFFMLVLITGAGDELQGIKKGVIELADALVINKADGENKIKAQTARAEYNRALHFLPPATAGWQAQAYTASALTGEGIPEIWQVIETFREFTRQSGLFHQRRREQARAWLHTLLEEQLRQLFFRHPSVESALSGIEEQVTRGDLPVTTAVQQLLRLFQEN
jgi:LAO/AO transport system kinase